MRPMPSRKNTMKFDRNWKNADTIRDIVSVCRLYTFFPQKNYLVRKIRRRKCTDNLDLFISVMSITVRAVTIGNDMPRAPVAVRQCKAVTDSLCLGKDCLRKKLNPSWIPGAVFFEVSKSFIWRRHSGNIAYTKAVKIDCN